jgi:hypothetical protein
MSDNGRDQATDILSGTDALVAAAEVAQAAIKDWRAALAEIKEDQYARATDSIEWAEAEAKIVEGLCVYAATVGKWAAR